MYVYVYVYNHGMDVLSKLSSLISYEFYQIYMTNCRISHNDKHRYINNSKSYQVINTQIKTEERFEFDKFPFDRLSNEKLSN